MIQRLLDLDPITFSSVKSTASKDMKRFSPEGQRDGALSKRRSTVPPSPPQSQHGSPVTSSAKGLTLQQTIERVINAKFELDYKEDIVEYMHELEVILPVCISRDTSC